MFQGNNEFMWKNNMKLIIETNLEPIWFVFLAKFMKPKGISS